MNKKKHQKKPKKQNKTKKTKMQTNNNVEIVLEIVPKMVILLF